MDDEKPRTLKSLEQSLRAGAGKSPHAPTTAGGPGGIAPSRFRLFCQINRKISEMSDLKSTLEEILDAAILLTGAERGLLLLRDENESLGPLPGIRVGAARKLHQKTLAEDAFRVSLTAVHKAIEDCETLVTDNAQLDPRFAEKKSVLALGLTAILVVPLEIRSQAIGAVYLDHRFETGLFSPEDVLLMEAMAAQAALAIEKAEHLRELEEARKRLEGTVKDQEKKIAVLSSELTRSRDKLRYGYEEIIGQSPGMMKVFEMLDHVSDTTIPVWILGESGTGKELVARSLHLNSARAKGPFVAENVSAIPETLLESELFGHKKGAFTHADRDRVGLFEQASGGTLFLDEVADMSLAMQAKLLRVLQEGEIRPVGSSKKVKIDVRLVTASHRDLDLLVRQSKFRQDLFFRINGLTVRLPALRERRDDIPLLVDHLAQRISKGFGLPPAPVEGEALQVLVRRDWPGNIRELKSVLRNLLLFSKGQPVTKGLIDAQPELFRSGSAAPGGTASQEDIERVSDDAECARIAEALRKHRLDKQKTAKELGISLRSLYNHLERLGIPKKKRLLASYVGMR